MPSSWPIAISSPPDSKPDCYSGWGHRRRADPRSVRRQRHDACGGRTGRLPLDRCGDDAALRRNRAGTLGRALSQRRRRVHRRRCHIVTCIWKNVGRADPLSAITRYGDLRYGAVSQPALMVRVLQGKHGSLEFQVGCRACGLNVWKSSLPAIRKMTVLMVDRRLKPRALRLADWNRPLMASRKPLV